MLPSDPSKATVDGYLDIEPEVARLPFAASLLRMPNNTLGSYGAYLHTYAMNRARRTAPFAYYIFAEDDYVPLRPHFDGALHAMFVSAFGGADAVGCLAGLVQGRPVEPRSRYEMHLESSHVMSAAALERVFSHTFGRARWHGSTTALMEHLAGETSDRSFGRIQYGFGLLLAAAGVPMRDWSAAFRVPYWNHHTLVDWSGPMHAFAVPAERVLIAPTQYLFHTAVKQCCHGTDCDEADRTAFCSVSRADDDMDACCRTRQGALPELRALRARWSVPRDPLVDATLSCGTLALRGVTVSSPNGTLLRVELA